jgi:hypothetical protein
MSLNKINLNKELLSALYSESLVQLTPSTAMPEPSVPKFLGNNARHILLVVNNPELPFLSDEELQFLTNILGACRLSLADVAIVNNYSLSLAQLQAAIDSLEPQIFILFGVTPEELDLPILFPPFQVQSFNKRTYLSGPSLAQLEQDKTQKQKLWMSLKQLFGI